MVLRSGRSEPKARWKEVWNPQKHTPKSRKNSTFHTKKRYRHVYGRAYRHACGRPFGMLRHAPLDSSAPRPVIWGNGTPNPRNKHAVDDADVEPM